MLFSNSDFQIPTSPLLFDLHLITVSGLKIFRASANFLVGLQVLNGNIPKHLPCQFSLMRLYCHLCPSQGQWRSSQQSQQNSSYHMQVQLLTQRFLVQNIQDINGMLLAVTKDPWKNPSLWEQQQDILQNLMFIFRHLNPPVFQVSSEVK